MTQSTDDSLQKNKQILTTQESVVMTVGVELNIVEVQFGYFSEDFFSSLTQNGTGIGYTPNCYFRYWNLYRHRFYVLVHHNNN